MSVRLRVRVRMMVLLRISAILTLVGLALMCWGVLEPTPLPTILAMSFGQVVGTTAFGLYLLAIIIDLRRDARAKRRLIDSGERPHDHEPAAEPAPASEPAPAPAPQEPPA